MDAWRQCVINEAVKWLRTPWMHRTRVLGAGVDCAHLAIAVYSGAGLIDEFDPGDYPQDMMLHSREERFIAQAERYMTRIDAPSPGDMVLWKFGRTFSHAGIVVEWPRFIHAYRVEHQVCYGDDRDQYLASRAKRFYTPAAA